MLLAFAERAITGVVFSALLVGGAAYLGNSTFFDLLALIGFVSIALVFRRNRDLLTLSGIFILERAAEELAWRTMDNSVLFKIPLYLLFLGLAGSLADGKLRAFLIVVLSSSIVAEIYWHMTSYNAPYILWMNYMIAATLLVRHAIVRRSFWLIDLTGKSGSSLDLEVKLLGANSAFFFLYSLAIVEYFLRHLFGLKEILIIHYSFPYLSQSITLFILYMLVVESVRYLKTQELKA